MATMRLGDGKSAASFKRGKLCSEPARKAFAWQRRSNRFYIGFHILSKSCYNHTIVCECVCRVYASLNGIYALFSFRSHAFARAILLSSFYVLLRSHIYSHTHLAHTIKHNTYAVCIARFPRYQPHTFRFHLHINRLRTHFAALLLPAGRDSIHSTRTQLSLSLHRIVCGPRDAVFLTHTLAY